MTFLFVATIVVVFVVGEVEENANHLKLLPSSGVYKLKWNVYIVEKKIAVIWSPSSQFIVDQMNKL